MAVTLAPGLTLQHPTVLAPMEGVTDPAFRALIAAKGGLGLLTTEFVRVSRAPLSPEVMRRAVVKVPGVPLSVQVMGNEAHKMAEAATHVAAAGADAVDLNLGCPMPRVVRKGVGAAMLKDLGLLRDVLGAMREATPGPLTAKIRAGWDDAAHVLRIGEVLEEAGVDALAVHPRRRVDFYEGVADWRIVRALARHLRMPVVGNGDVWYADDAFRMRAETGCVAVMIGRPALRNPWIFQQIAEREAGLEPFRPSGRDVAAHLHGLRAVFTPKEPWRRRGRRKTREPALGKLKEHLRYVGRTLPDGGAFRREALRLPSVDALLSFVDARLAGLPADALDLAASPLLGLERSGACETAPQGAPEDERAA
ncbi:MAG: tRNA-dihydrouridine synthase family protein [Myxococcota bacterium]